MKLQAKIFELNFLLKLSDLKSNFTLTLGYLNPALNNPGQETKSNANIEPGDNESSTACRKKKKMTWLLYMSSQPPPEKSFDFIWLLISSLIKINMNFHL